jgi:hypothetical protein
VQRVTCDASAAGCDVGAVLAHGIAGGTLPLAVEVAGMVMLLAVDGVCVTGGIL